MGLTKEDARDISIHALREEGDVMDLDKQANTSISIHALREEGDLISCIRLEMTRIFLSTPSARRATFRNEVLEMSCEISIHALREEGDCPCRRKD